MDSSTSESVTLPTTVPDRRDAGGMGDDKPVEDRHATWVVPTVDSVFRYAVVLLRIVRAAVSFIKRDWYDLTIYLLVFKLEELNASTMP